MDRMSHFTIGSSCRRLLILLAYQRKTPGLAGIFEPHRAARRNSAKHRISLAQLRFLSPHGFGGVHSMRELMRLITGEGDYGCLPIIQGNL